jgi:glutathione synthase
MKSVRLDPGSLALQVSPHGSYPTSGFVEISTIYFRAGYTPDDFPTPAHYETRFVLERSLAIKCPSIPLQLAGGKKVQEVLTKPGVLEKFLLEEVRPGEDVFGEAEVKDVRESWMKMWGLGDDVGRGEGSGLEKARSLASSLVLKPQREGGGNNVYKEAIPAFLDTLPVKEQEAWIAMELITPPTGTSNYLVRAVGGMSGSEVLRAEVVSELGIFGWALFGGGEVRAKEVGWLVRTKGRETNEGGVATGFSVLDSVLLIDDE